jgi:hypothetical protein
MVRNPVKIVPNGKYAGVVSKTQFAEDSQRPVGANRNREGGGPVPYDLYSRGVFHSFLGATSVFAKFLGTQLVDEAVPIAVASDLVAIRPNFSDQFRKTRCNPSQYKEGCPDLVPVKESQHTVSISDHAALQGIPVVSPDVARDSLGVKIVLDINGEPVSNRHFGLCC